MERVRIGIIGCGGMGRHHGRRFAEIAEAEIVGLADTHPDNLADFAERVFGEDAAAPPTFSDHRALLAEVEMDGVVIVTPHAHHFQQAMDAISAGCHVLVEKPMVISTPDALALIAHADLHGRTVSVAFPGPFSREFQYVRRLIETGELGEIYLITGVCTQNWLTHVRGSWRTRPELSGGGNMYDSGAHMFNGMLFLTGLAATEVFASIDCKGEEVDVTGTACIRFQNGALGTAAVSGDAPLMEQGIYVQGTRGAVKCSIYGGSMEVWIGSDKIASPVLPAVTTLQQNFVDCILGRATSPCPPLLGLRQAQLMDAIYESARTGSVVRVVADGA
jgi:predicted dehydrogenase